MIAVTVKPRGGNARALARGAKQHAAELQSIAAQTGVPAAQRDAAVIEKVKVPQIGTAPRTADFTVRKMTRIERMKRAGVLELHEADACEWYADTAALAWDTTGLTAVYDGGGSSPDRATAGDRLMARNDAIAHARDMMREVAEMLPRPYAEIFDAIVCRNEALGPVAAVAFPDLARSQAGERTRTVLKFCANKLHERFGRFMAWAPAPIATRTRDVTPAAPSASDNAPAATASAMRDLVPMIEAAIELRRISGAADMVLWVAAELRDALAAAIGATPASTTMFCGVPLSVRDGWRWGWVLVDAGETP